jgi:hypothetical protein
MLVCVVEHFAAFVGGWRRYVLALQAASWRYWALIWMR